MAVPAGTRPPCVLGGRDPLPWRLPSLSVPPCGPAGSPFPASPRRLGAGAGVWLRPAPGGSRGPVPTGYFGGKCVDACQLNPCEHAGACVHSPGSPRGYTCECGASRYGPYCENR